MISMGGFLRVTPPGALGSGPAAPVGGEASMPLRSFCVELHKLAPHPKTEYKIGDESDKAGLTWTLWHSLKELRIQFANPNQPDAVTVDDWHDTVSFAIGATYKLAPEFALRAGFSYDPTPIPDAAHRDPRIPDADRLMLAVGGGYAWSDNARVELAYEHIFHHTAPIDASSPSGDLLIGNTQVSADIFAVQLTLKY